MISAAESLNVSFLVHVSVTSFLYLICAIMPSERGPKGHAIAYVVWLPYAHAYASLTPLHSWLTRGTFLTWPYAKLTPAHSIRSSSVRIGNAYASLFFHLRETIHVNCVKNNSVCFCSNHIIFRHLLLPTFRKLYSRFHEHPVSYNSLSRARIFSKHMCLSIAHLHQSVLTPKACLGGIVGNWWEIVGCAYAGLTLTLRGPYADFGNFFI